MQGIVFPGTTGAVDVVVPVPGSKSIANRALVCAFLAAGTSYLRGVPDGDDCARMIAAFEAAGAIRHLDGRSLTVAGGVPERLPSRVDCGLAGTTSRFLTAVAATSAREHVIDGGEPLRHRPMEDLHDALRGLGGRVVGPGGQAGLPVRAGGSPMHGGTVRVSGTVSSQFLSALMLIGPVLENGLEIVVLGDLVSRSYAEMTRSVMARFGADVDTTDSATRWVVGGSGYRATDLTVEADHSSAAFPIVAVLLGGGRVTIPGLRRGTGQGDERMLDIATAMGASVEATEVGVTVTHDGSDLIPVDLDLTECSDLVPAVVVACLAAAGTSKIRGVGFIRAKESNRIEGLAGELQRLGAVVRPTDDGLDIVGGRALTPAMLRTLNDHRLAMAFAVLSRRCPGLGIDDASVVAKSWPAFLTDMESLLGRCRTAQ
jgi:3-phosphoshikimate 1-carboxyvinyltransferase